MFCSHCGRSLLDESLFCEHCGQPVDDPDSALDSIPSTHAAVVSPNASSNRRFLASASVDYSHGKSALKHYLPIIIASVAAILLIGAAIAYAVATAQHSEDANRTGETAQNGILSDCVWGKHHPGFGCNVSVGNKLHGWSGCSTAVL